MALVILVQICRDDRKVEEDAYASMPSDFLDSKGVTVGEGVTKDKDQQMANEHEISTSPARLILQVTFTSRQSSVIYESSLRTGHKW